MRLNRTALAIAVTTALAAGAFAVAAEASNPTVKINEKQWSVKRAAPVITLHHGKTYTIAVHNTGTINHDLLIDGHGLDDVGIHNKAPIQPGKSKSFTVKFPKAGTYEFYCAIKGHRARGMQLKVVVK